MAILDSPILCYHQVATEAEAGRRLNIAPERLGRHVDFFARRGFRFACARQMNRSKGKNVFFTFDDAYLSALTKGLEILKSQGQTGTFYAVPGFVGQSSSWDEDKARPLADWTHLLYAQMLGFEIGNHTQTHVRLSDVTQHEAKGEWMKAHTALTDHGISVVTACYPYGVAGNTRAEDLTALGYGTALGIGRWPWGNDPFDRPRIVVAFGDALPMLLYKLYVKPFVRSRMKR